MLHPPAPYSLRTMTLGDLPSVLAIERASYPTPRRNSFFYNELVDNPLAHYQVLTRRRTGAGSASSAMPGSGSLPEKPMSSPSPWHRMNAGAGWANCCCSTLLTLVCDCRAVAGDAGSTSRESGCPGFVFEVSLRHGGSSAALLSRHRRRRHGHAGRSGRDPRLLHLVEPAGGSIVRAAGPCGFRRLSLYKPSRQPRPRRNPSREVFPL